MIKVLVASENPVKISAVRLGFEKMFPGEKFEVVGVASNSGVPDQPVGHDQTLEGAKNRVADLRARFAEYDYYTGIEGGIDHNDLGTEVFAWVHIKHRDGTEGLGKTGSFYLPPAITDLIKSGHELSTASDKVFNETKSGHKNGTVGILTGDVIDRTAYYMEAMVYALIPFKNPALYSSKAASAAQRQHSARAETAG